MKQLQVQRDQLNNWLNQLNIGLLTGFAVKYQFLTGIAIIRVKKQGSKTN